MDTIWIQNFGFINSQIARPQTKRFRQLHSIISSRSYYTISPNFLDNKLSVRLTIRANLGKFICAKFEISLKSQENISKSANYTERRQLSPFLNTLDSKMLKD